MVRFKVMRSVLWKNVVNAIGKKKPRAQKPSTK